MGGKLSVGTGMLGDVERHKGSKGCLEKLPLNKTQNMSTQSVAHLTLALDAREEETAS